ncbi:Ras-related protein RABD1 [Tritrichomonas foetus]|uniref:Ras-related protein RABD1 n=1 Tax=Tritrichomonas foetus TaxID=1144522 RepID=A0A1J4KW22_9EUKA|nr:Ras-related protein RABD1 [Tritrichomonas foetus]|eukprot:OHT15521.1 Ras-related protein RABD1 [Tritrichomonas foetus]
MICFIVCFFFLTSEVLIIGDSAVGKSCLLIQFADQTFSDNYVSTIGVDFKIRTIESGGRQVKLQIWDTAGQERFQSITANYYHGSHAIAVVYDITNRQSFENVRKWLTEVDKLANPLVCKLIVGNKADLEDKRVVSRSEGQNLADGFGIPFIETSAKTAYNVKDMFNQMCLAISSRQGNNRPNNTTKIPDWSNRQTRQVNGNGGLCSC